MFKREVKPQTVNLDKILILRLFPKILGHDFNIAGEEISQQKNIL